MTNWQTKKLGDIGTFFKGSGIPKDSARSGDLPAVRYGELYTSFDIFINQVRSSIDQSTAMSAAKILKGDILFAGSGETVEEIGKSAVYQLDQEGYAGGDIVIMRPGSDQDSRFLGQALNSDEARKQLRKFGQGQSVVHVYRKDLEKLELLLPEKPEQERIVGVLEVWDEYIKKLEQKIALKEQLKKGLMQQLLTGKRRLPGFSGEWNESRLSDIVDVKKGSGLSKEQLSNDGRKCILYGEIYTKYDEIIDEVQSRTATTVGVRSKVNDVLVPASTTTSSLDVATATHISEDDVLLGGDINILRPKTDTNGKFLALLLSGPEKINLAKRAQGITIVHLYGKDFVKMKVILPSKDEQDAIVGVIEAARREIKIMEPMLNELKLQKKYLLKNLITGTIRTPENLKPKGANS